MKPGMDWLPMKENQLFITVVLFFSLMILLECVGVQRMVKKKTIF